MIIGGGSRGMSEWFSNYLTKDRPDEIVRLMEIRGLPADNIPDAFAELRLLASASQRCENFMYHAHINPRAEEPLTEPQWDRALDTLEHNLGLDQQPRLVVEHEKDGRIHRHVIWGRIDPDTMKAIPDSNNYAIHMRTADELERLFGHERTERGRDHEGRNPDDWEVSRGQETGIDPRDVKAELTALYRQADSGQAFAAALDEHGYILARGDRRDFVVVDRAGDEHALGKKKLGAKAAEIRARMADIDRDALPSVAEARAMARDRLDDADEQQKSAPADKKRKHGLELAAQEVAETVVEAFRGKGHAPANAGAPEPSPESDTATAAPEAMKDVPATAEPADASPQPEPPGSVNPQENTTAPKESPRDDEPHAGAANPAARGSEVPYATRIPEPSPEAAQRPTVSKLPEPLIPIAVRRPSLFARMRDGLAKGAEWLRAEPTVAESADAPTRSKAPSAPEVIRVAVEPVRFEPAAVDSALTRFERLAGELAQETKAHGPPVAEFTAIAAALVAAPVLSEFERHAQDRLAALREAEGDANRLTAAGIDWRARQSGMAYLPEHAPDGQLSAFDRLTWDKFSATRDNGGEPVTRDGSGFWQRVRSLLTDVLEHVAEWAADRLDGFAERLRRDRNTDNERER
jgi:Relaxase/Mobilisation nuclease domain